MHPGYSWSVTAVVGFALDRGQDGVDPATPMVPGNQPHVRFGFVAARPGTTTIVLTQGNVFSPITRRTIHVTVQ